jgi:broad specificity phosphatase PhoE
MSTLVLVRHGKASSLAPSARSHAFSQDGYDQLSEPGFAQSRALGEHWAAEGTTFERVFVGPRKRHVQTYETVAEVMRAKGCALPEATLAPELDEHEGISLVFKLLPELAREDEELREVTLAMGRGAWKSADLLSVFRKLTRRWARGEIGHHEVESWPAFRARVERGLAKMTAGVPRGIRVCAFTSGGTVAAAVGLAVGASDEKVLDLSWALLNGALTELAFSDQGWGLVRFNGTPHLHEALLTAV